jgi:hypothetical protein
MTRRGLSPARFLKRKPCPFCGSKQKALCFVRNMKSEPRWLVSCNNVKCRVQPETDFFVRGADAVRAWNKRGRHGRKAAS